MKKGKMTSDANPIELMRQILSEFLSAMWTYVIVVSHGLSTVSANRHITLRRPISHDRLIVSACYNWSWSGQAW